MSPSSSSSSSSSPNLVQFRDNESTEFNKNWLTLSQSSPPSLSLSFSSPPKVPKTFQLFDLDEPETLQVQQVQEVRSTQVIGFRFTRLNPSSGEDEEIQEVPVPPSVASTLYRPPARIRRIPTQTPGGPEEPSILDPPPFPWATKLWATVHSMDYLVANGINSINGEVSCRKCENRETVSFDLRTKFMEVEKFVGDRAHLMHSRAPPVWLNPGLMTCSKCEVGNQMRPILDDRESHINWLFLFLGQWLGCCTLGQLKWFCKYTQNHRTGAKDRVLFYTYAAIGKQLDPNGVFNLMQT